VAADTQNLLVYDGQCPFCTRYVRWMRLKDTVGEMRLVDARGDDPVVDQVRALGFDLDQGMVLHLDAQWYHGAEALRVLAMLSSPVGVFNRLNRHLFSGQWRARSWYPLLRALRHLVLWLLRRPSLRHPRSASSPCQGGEDEDR